MAETKAKPVTDNVAQPAPEVVPKAQYDSLLAQAQGAINDANATIAELTNDKRVLQDTLKIQNRLIERFLNEKK